MRTLIVEDDFVSRIILQKYLSVYGDCDIAVDGEEAIQAFTLAWEASAPYDLICMDIMMPNLNGQAALRRIREIEHQRGASGREVKVIMTTAVNDKKQVMEAFYKGGASSYFVKPIDRNKLIEELRTLGLIGDDDA